MNAENVQTCPCPNIECKNNGICSACVANHRRKGNLTHCMFPDNDGDKSYENLYSKLKIHYEKS